MTYATAPEKVCGINSKDFDFTPMTPKEGPRVSRPPFWIPLFLLLSASMLILLFNLDRTVADFFWSPDEGWFLRQTAVVTFLYKYGAIPALAAGLCALIIWLLSLFVQRVAFLRKGALFIAVTLVLGPGLLVNTVLKKHFGRPRPRDVVAFGGTDEFRPLGASPFVGHGRSFPSGHSAAGFFWLAPAIYAWSRSRKISIALVAAAFVHGSLMSFARIAGGAHWLSDTLWAAGCVYFTAWGTWRVALAQLPQASFRIRWRLFGSQRWSKTGGRIEDAGAKGVA